MSTYAILFDLDQTLVLTSPLEPLRKERNWAKVYQSFGLTQLPPGTMVFIKKAITLGELGVVTNSPRPYAEKLLKYHKLDIPVVVAYHDVTLRKPYPECIQKASKTMNIPIENCIYVGDMLEDIQAAKGAGVIPVAITWDGLLDTDAVKKMGYKIHKDWNEVFLTISGIISFAKE